MPDGRFQHVAGGLGQGRHLRLVERMRPGGRVNTRLKEDFVGDPVADARRHFLVEQHGFDGRFAVLQTVGQGLGRHAQGVVAQAFVLLVGRHAVGQVEAGKFARIGDGQPLTPAKNQHQSVEARGVGRTGVVVQAARHAKMNHQHGAAGRYGEQVLANPLGVGKPGATQRFSYIGDGGF